MERSVLGRGSCGRGVACASGGQNVRGRVLNISFESVQRIVGTVLDKGGDGCRASRGGQFGALGVGFSRDRAGYQRGYGMRQNRGLRVVATRESACRQKGGIASWTGSKFAACVPLEDLEYVVQCRLQRTRAVCWAVCLNRRGSDIGRLWTGAGEFALCSRGRRGRRRKGRRGEGAVGGGHGECWVLLGMRS